LASLVLLGACNLVYPYDDLPPLDGGGFEGPMAVDLPVNETGCAGCWSGGSCVPQSEQDRSKCGANGASCTDCTSMVTPCRSMAMCKAGSCRYSGAPGQLCHQENTSGRCVEGVCCTTCIQRASSSTRASCVLKRDAQHCGKAGADCKPCGQGQVCEGGTCREACGPYNCLGCCQNGGCVFFRQGPSRCGMGGVPCKSCLDIGKKKCVWGHCTE